MSWINCPVSGRRWPAPMRSFLKTCCICHGLIDTRHNAWLERESDAMHWPGTCTVQSPEAPAT